MYNNFHTILPLFSSRQMSLFRGSTHCPYGASFLHTFFVIHRKLYTCVTFVVKQTKMAYIKGKCLHALKFLPFIWAKIFFVCIATKQVLRLLRLITRINDLLIGLIACLSIAIKENIHAFYFYFFHQKFPF